LSIERVEKRMISSQEAPDWPEPIAAAVEWNGLVFASGELGVDPETMRPIGLHVGDQTRQALANLSATLRAAGSSLSHVLKVNAYLNDPADYDEFNRVFGRNSQSYLRRERRWASSSWASTWSRSMLWHMCHATRVPGRERGLRVHAVTL
jgi:enamine deaminase RidA (YjgF/YER057c/UK114 family)